MNKNSCFTVCIKPHGSWYPF